MTAHRNAADDWLEARLRRSLRSEAEAKLAELAQLDALTSATTAVHRRSAWAAAGPERWRRLRLTDAVGAVIIEIDETDETELTATITYPGLGPSPRLVALAWTGIDQAGRRDTSRVLIPVVADAAARPLRYGLGSVAHFHTIELHAPEVLSPSATLTPHDVIATLSLTVYSSAIDHWLRFSRLPSCDPEVAALIADRLA